MPASVPGISVWNIIRMKKKCKHLREFKTMMKCPNQGYKVTGMRKHADQAK